MPLFVCVPLSVYNSVSLFVCVNCSQSVLLCAFSPFHCFELLKVSSSHNPHFSHVGVVPLCLSVSVLCLPVPMCLCLSVYVPFSVLCLCISVSPCLCLPVSMCLLDILSAVHCPSFRSTVRRRHAPLGVHGAGRRRMGTRTNVRLVPTQHHRVECRVRFCPSLCVCLTVPSRVCVCMAAPPPTSTWPARPR